MTWVWTFFNNYSNHPRMCMLSTLCGSIDKHSHFDIYIYIYYKDPSICSHCTCRDVQESNDVRSSTGIAGHKLQLVLFLVTDVLPKNLATIRVFIWKFSPLWRWNLQYDRPQFGLHQVDIRQYFLHSLFMFTVEGAQSPLAWDNLCLLCSTLMRRGPQF